MKKILPVLVILVLAYTGWLNFDGDGAMAKGGDHGSGTATALTRFDESHADTQVTGEGVVVKVLPDDDEGSRHQRFIMKLESGQTVLVAHNIDLAPRIPTLAKGDLIEFNGEFEWNDKGGVVHWTHHDPGGRHPGGWLKHAGKTYE